MSQVGDIECKTQNRVVKLFSDKTKLNYEKDIASLRLQHKDLSDKTRDLEGFLEKRAASATANAQAELSNRNDEAEQNGIKLRQERAKTGALKLELAEKIRSNDKLKKNLESNLEAVANESKENQSIKGKLLGLITTIKDNLGNI